MLNIVAVLLVCLNLRPAIASVAPLLEAIGKSIGLSSASAGVLNTLPVLCFAISALLVPRLANRLSMERAIWFGLLTLAVGIVFRTFFGRLGLFLGTFVISASIGVFMVLLPAIIKRDFPGHAGLLMGGYGMLLNLGAAIAAGVTVPIQKLANGDWRAALAFWVLPVLLAAAFWRPFMQSRPPQTGPSRHGNSGLLRDALAWQVTVYFGCQSALAYCVFGWLPTILIDRGMSPMLAGLSLSASILLQLATGLVIPWMSGRRLDERVAIATTIALMIIGFLGCIYAPMDSIWLWIAVLGLGQGGSFGMALSLILMRAPNARTAASLSSMVQGFGYLLSAVGPLVAGILHDVTHAWNPVAIFCVAVGCVAISAGIGAGRKLYVAAADDRPT